MVYFLAMEITRRRLAFHHLVFAWSALCEAFFRSAHASR